MKNKKMDQAGIAGAKAGEALVKLARNFPDANAYDGLDNLISLVMQNLSHNFDNQKEKEKLMYLKQELIFLKGRLGRLYDF